MLFAFDLQAKYYNKALALPVWTCDQKLCEQFNMNIVKNSWWFPTAEFKNNADD